MTQRPRAQNLLTDELVARESEGLMNAIVPSSPLCRDLTRLRVYPDATVVRGCVEGDSQEASRHLIDAFVHGNLTLLLSHAVVSALEDERHKVKAVLSRVPDAHTEFLADTPAATELVEAYVRVGAVAESARPHALHFALATLAKADVLVSWDFKNIVNIHRIRDCNYVNVARGQRRLLVHTPSALGLHASCDASKAASFSNVKLMREIRDTIAKEIAGMSFEERRKWEASKVATNPTLRKFMRRTASAGPSTPRRKPGQREKDSPP